MSINVNLMHAIFDLADVNKHIFIANHQLWYVLYLPDVIRAQIIMQPGFSLSAVP